MESIRNQRMVEHGVSAISRKRVSDSRTRNSGRASVFGVGAYRRSRAVLGTELGTVNKALHKNKNKAHHKNKNKFLRTK